MKKIEHLHREGKAFLVYPLRVVYFFGKKTDEVPVQTMVSVSKKKFKRAVKRNRIKRLMRETYRLNKAELIDSAEQKQINAHIAFQYISNEEMDFQTLNVKMQLTLKKLIEILSNESTPENS